MRLNDHQILRLLSSNPQLITPLPKENDISGVTCDIHLGEHFKYYSKTEKSIIIDPLQPNTTMVETKRDTKDGFIIEPNQFVIGHTEQSVSLPDDVVAWVDGKSSLARFGLLVHISAPRIDPGFKGQIVLEFFNANPHPIKLTPGMEIAALSFEQLDSRCAKPYQKRAQSKYSNQSGAQETIGIMKNDC